MMYSKDHHHHHQIKKQQKLFNETKKEGQTYTTTRYDASGWSERGKGMES